MLYIHVSLRFSLDDFLSTHSALNNVLINCFFLLNVWLFICILSNKNKLCMGTVITYIVTELSGLIGEENAYPNFMESGW